MNGRWALFVDAGWLFAAGTTAAFGERRARHETAWDPPALVDALVHEAAALVPPAAELLRTYWYDGAPRRLPIGDHLQIAALPDVKLRLGRTGANGQKGVDGLIIHDLITLALDGRIADAVLLSGDEDLLEAVESAQASGARVHLLEIPIGGIAPSLLQAVDRTRRLDDAFWQSHLRSLAASDSAREAAAPVDERQETETAGPLPARASPQTTPPMILRPPAVRPAWLDAPHPTAAPAQVSSELVASGGDLARSWAATATPDEYATLLSARPILPQDLDANLLRTVSLGAWLSVDERRAVRDAFWTALVAAEPGGPRPPARQPGQADQPDRPDHPDGADQPDRPDHPDRPDQPDQPDQPD